LEVKHKKNCLDFEEKKRAEAKTFTLGLQLLMLKVAG
jgi:hypothetical protein